MRRIFPHYSASIEKVVSGRDVVICRTLLDPPGASAKNCGRPIACYTRADLAPGHPLLHSQRWRTILLREPSYSADAPHCGGVADFGPRASAIAPQSFGHEEDVSQRDVRYGSPPGA